MKSQTASAVDAGSVGVVGRSTNLDVLRALAALAVLVGHAYQLSGSNINGRDLRPDKLLISNSAAGVWLFFALSGYLIAGPYIRALITGTALPRTRPYALKRVARIYPAYLLAFVIAALVGPSSPIVHWWQWPVHLALLHNLVPGEEQAILFASWTLTLEALFYLAVPVAARAVRRVRPGAIPAAVMAAGLLALGALSLLVPVLGGAVQATHIKIGLWLRFVFPAVISSFVPGMLVAVAVTQDRQGRPSRLLDSFRSRPLWWAALAAGFVGVACVMFSRGNVYVYDLSRLPFGIAFGILVGVGVGSPEWTSRPARLLAWLGLISYGIYLWQAVILQIIFKHGLHRLAPMAHTGGTAFVVHIAYVLALTLPVAWVSWTLVEQPAMRWAARRADVTFDSA